MSDVAFTIVTPYGPRMIALRDGPLAFATDGTAWREDGAAWQAIPSPAPRRGLTLPGETFREMSDRAQRSIDLGAGRRTA